MSNSVRKLRVFLAHSSKDKPAVRDFFRLLRIDGFQPWLDEESLVGGQDWKTEIERVIRETDAVAVFLSSGSVDSAGFIHKEIGLALDVAERQPDRSIFIVPIRLEDCRLPDRLQNLHWISIPEAGFSIGSGYLRLQRSLITRGAWLQLLPVGTDNYEEIPWLFVKGFPTEFPVGGRYLVRGVNSNDSRYYGVARLREGNEIMQHDKVWRDQIDEKSHFGREYRLVARIGTQTLNYTGRLEGSQLVFSGDHEVKYEISWQDGLLIGSWGEGGVEELIPASPFCQAAFPESV